MENNRYKEILKQQKIENFYKKTAVLELMSYLSRFKNNFNLKELPNQGIKSFKIIFEEENEFFKEVEIKY